MLTIENQKDIRISNIMKISAIFLAVFVGLASASDSLENDRLLAQLDLESLKQAAAQLPSLMAGGEPVAEVIFVNRNGHCILVFSVLTIFRPENRKTANVKGGKSNGFGISMSYL